MREIKFRAWDKKACRFVWSGPIQNFPTINDDDMALSYKWEKGRLIKTLSCMDDLIWMEHTGLRDRAGQEIYEGDIIYLAGYGDYIVEWPFIQLFESLFEGDIGGIIGNIYENPEL